MQDAAIHSENASVGQANMSHKTDSRPHGNAWLRRALESQGEAWALVERTGRIDDTVGEFFSLLDSPSAHRRPGARLRDVVWALRSDDTLSWPPNHANPGWNWTAQRRDGQSVTLSTRPLGSQGWVMRAELGATPDPTKVVPSMPGLYHPITRLPRQPLLLDRLQQAVERSRRTITHRFALVLVVFDQQNRSGALTNDPNQLRAIAHDLIEAVRPADTVAHLNDDTIAVIVEPLRGDDASTQAAMTAVIENLREAMLEAKTSGSALPAPRFATAIGDSGSHPSDLIAAARLSLATTGQSSASGIRAGSAGPVSLRAPKLTSRASASSEAAPSGSSPCEIPVAIEFDLKSRRASGISALCERIPTDTSLHAGIARYRSATGWPGGWAPDLVVVTQHLPDLDALISIKNSDRKDKSIGRLIVELGATAVTDAPDKTVALADGAVRHDIHLGVQGVGSCPDALIGQLPLQRIALHPDLVSAATQDAQARIRLAATIAWAHHHGLRVVAPRADADDPDPSLTELLTKLGCDLHRGAHVIHQPNQA